MGPDAQAILDGFRSKQERVEAFHGDDGVAPTPLVDISDAVAAQVSLWASVFGFEHIFWCFLARNKVILTNFDVIRSKFGVMLLTTLHLPHMWVQNMY